MIGEEPSQKYWILSLPVDNCWRKCVICILRFVVFSDFGNINIFKERFIQEFLIIFCYIQVRVSLGSVCMHLFGNMHLQVRNTFVAGR